MSLDRSELRADARRFENWEFNYAAVLGLGAAVDYALALGLDSIRDRIVALSAGVRAALDALPGVVLRDLGGVNHQCGLVTFNVEGLESADVMAQLKERGVVVSVSGPSSTLCAPRTQAQTPTLPNNIPHLSNIRTEFGIFTNHAGAYLWLRSGPAGSTPLSARCRRWCGPQSITTTAGRSCSGSWRRWQNASARGRRRRRRLRRSCAAGC